MHETRSQPRPQPSASAQKQLFSCLQIAGYVPGVLLCRVQWYHPELASKIERGGFQFLLAGARESLLECEQVYSLGVWREGELCALRFLTPPGEDYFIARAGGFLVGEGGADPVARFQI